MAGFDWRGSMQAFLRWKGWQRVAGLCVKAWRATAGWHGWKRMFSIGAVWTFVLTALCTAGLIFVFVSGREQSIPAYGLYAMSAYTLIAVCLAIPGAIRRVRVKLYSIPRIKRLLTDKSLHFSLELWTQQIINFGYGLFKITSGVRIGSAWIGADGIYNFTQGLIQLFQILRRRKLLTRKQQWESYRLCGWLVLLLHLTMTGLVFQMVNWGRAEDYPGYMIFATAAFAFYKLISSFVAVAKDRRHKHPVDASVRLLDLSQAFFSLFSLQVALLHAFGEGAVWEKWMNTATGCVVCMLVVGMGIYMIRRANREIKRMGEI